MKFIVALISCVLFSNVAEARGHHYHYSDVGTDRHEGVGGYRAPVWVPGEPRLRHRVSHRGHGYTPWCGIYMRTQVGGDPGPSYNLARNWAHWGSPAGGPGYGVVVVWPHHVGRVVGGECPAGAAMVNSGNDGNAVRTRCLPMRGVIAFRR